MSISHHLSDITLQDYAAGSLDNAMEVVIACHLTLCASCRTKSELADSIGGVLLVNGDSVQTEIDAQQLLARESECPIDGDQMHSQSDPGASDVPRPLARLLPCDLDELNWKRIAPGIKQYNLSQKKRQDGAFKLLRLDPGVTLSEHTHQDRELTLVLRGSYQDKLGRFKAGDIADLDEDVLHQPVVDTDEPCIALIATMSPVRYSGVLGRMLQPFVGI